MTEEQYHALWALGYAVVIIGGGLAIAALLSLFT